MGRLPWLEGLCFLTRHHAVCHSAVLYVIIMFAHGLPSLLILQSLQPRTGSQPYSNDILGLLQAETGLEKIAALQFLRQCVGPAQSMLLAFSDITGWPFANDSLAEGSISSSRTGCSYDE